MPKLLDDTVKDFIVGFTGTRSGMTPNQHTAVAGLVLEVPKPFVVLHGCAKGADREFHDIVRACSDNFATAKVHGYPSDSLQFDWAMTNRIPQITLLHDPLIRNREMAKQADFFIATPQTEQEVLRSGTWSTIRYRRSYGKHLIIVFPSGEFTVEGDGGEGIPWSNR